MTTRRALVWFKRDLRVHDHAPLVAALADADALALAIGSLHLGISVELLLDPDLDMDALRRSVRESISRMLTP